jgi:hypothetical protein
MMAKIWGKFLATISKGIKPFKRIFRCLDFDFRGCFLPLKIGPWWKSF